MEPASLVRRSYGPGRGPHVSIGCRYHWPEFDTASALLSTMGIRCSRMHGHARGSAMLLAVLPLFFAWRSLPSYFYCAAFPLFILLATKAFPEKSKRASLLQRPEPLPFDYQRAGIHDIPIPVGAGT